MGKATEYGQQMTLKPQYHSWFTFFTLNPVSGQAMLQNPFMPNFLFKNWNRFATFQEKESIKEELTIYLMFIRLSTLFFSDCFYFSKRYLPYLILIVAFPSTLFFVIMHILHLTLFFIFPVYLIPSLLLSNP